MPSEPAIPSVIGRLLAELSWAGSTIREYRNGGRGFENVLTAEALQALDLLPRSHFLGEVVARMHGADAARQLIITEVEAATITLLPGNHYLRPSASSHQSKIAVQPDAILESPSTYTVIEAKRLRRGSFQPKQLARELVLALRSAGERHALLLLLLPESPPVPVRGQGRMSIAEAISLHLADVLDDTDALSVSAEALLGQIDQLVCWITWQDVLFALTRQLANFHTQDLSVKSSMARLVGTVQAAIEWHGDA